MDETGRSTLHRTAVIPVKKEALSEKAIRGISSLSIGLRRSAETALGVVEKTSRQLKSYLSSDFEVLLLGLTKPNYDRPLQSDVNRFIATTKTFDRSGDSRSEDYPYRVTLRKLWAKIAESDARTVLKGLYLLHVLFASSERADAAVYHSLLLRMSKSEESEKTQCRYFDIATARRKFTDRAENAPLEGMIDRYSQYVLARGRFFVAGFDDLSKINYSMSAADICNKVQQNISATSMV